MRRLSHRAAWLLGSVNALDVTTSLRPSFIDALRAVPAKPTWLWIVQLVLLVASLAVLLRHAPRAVAAVRGLPVPRAALVVCGGFALVSVAHVALRTEHFPFSSVGMFSTAVPDPAPGVRVTRRMALLLPATEAGGTAEYLSLMREGNPWFARLDTGWDYKIGWFLHLYGLSWSSALGLVQEELRRAGLPPAIRLRVAIDRSRATLVPPRAREPRP